MARTSRTGEQATQQRRTGRDEGIGPVKPAREARQGFWDAPVLAVMVVSLALCAVAAIGLWAWIVF